MGWRVAGERRDHEKHCGEREGGRQGEREEKREYAYEGVKLIPVTLFFKNNISL